MPILWSVVELDTQADAVSGRCALVGLHTGDPGAAGTDNEASGGSPAYARVAPTVGASGDEGPLGVAQPATDGIAWATVTFDVPAGTYTWLSLWRTGSVFMGRAQVPTKTTSGQETVTFSLPFNANL